MVTKQNNVILSEEIAYEDVWQDGWDACHKRFEDILKRFPLECAMILNRLPLHPSQPDRILEHNDWLNAQGHTVKEN
jgi:hypothetical protein